MNKRVKKLGLIFSAVAVLFVTVILPFHYHSEMATQTASDHCSVCHFSLARAATPPSEPAHLVVFHQSELLVQKSEVFNINEFSASVSPRGPPSLS